ncbi:transporter substrate-binding domain-containing protein [Bdellovibrio sp. GT3]|uniref:transporter substrate-binding domain-containing protein n=1 Tax=Bdellovibrio sp. GT3 TaxID=3136282 RepID=UPI0030F2094C
MKSVFILVCCILLTSVFSIPTRAAPARTTQVSQACERNYTFGLITVPPIYFVQSGKKSGLGYEFSIEAMRRLECRFTEKVGVVSALMNSFTNNRLDFLGPLTDKVAFKNSEFIGLWNAPRILVIKKANIDVKAKNLEAYIFDSKLVFGTLIGGNIYYHEEEINTLRKSNRVRPYAGGEDIVRALRAGKVQALIAGPYILGHYFDKKELAEDYVQIQGNGNPLEWGFHLSTTRLNSDERGRLRNAFLKMKEDGTAERIQSKYKQFEFQDRE